MKLLLLAAALAQERVEHDARCLECHVQQGEDWKGSIHDRSGVGCVSCHGPDSLNSKQSRPHLYQEGFLKGTKRTNPRLCGACHKAEFQSFDKSAHAEYTRDETSRVLGCLSCHGFHDTVQAQRRQILEEHCRRCHKSASSEARKSGELYVQLADRLVRERSQLEARFGKPGIPFREEKGTADAAAQSLQAARILQHEASAAAYKRIQNQLQPAADLAQRAYNSLEIKERAFGWRFLWLGGFLALLGLNVLLVRIRAKRWRQHA
jgi:hypothetical protein